MKYKSKKTKNGTDTHRHLCVVQVRTMAIYLEL